MPPGVIDPPNRHAGSRSNALDAFLWVSLCVAFSLHIFDLCAHWWNSPWYRYSIVFIPLSIHAIRRGAPVKRRPTAGLALIGFGLALSLVAVMGAVVALGRPALAAAVIGLLLFQGRSSLAPASLVLWIVPVPHQVVSRIGGEAFAEGVFAACARLLAPLGVDATVHDEIARVADAQMAIQAAYGGLPLLVCLMGLGWYMAQRRAQDAAGSARTIFSAALLAPPIQIVSLIAALVVLATLGGPAATAWTSHAPWLIPFLVVLWVVPWTGER